MISKQIKVIYTVDNFVFETVEEAKNLLITVALSLLKKNLKLQGEGHLNVTSKN